MHISMPTSFDKTEGRKGVSVIVTKCLSAPLCVFNDWKRKVNCVVGVKASTQRLQSSTRLDKINTIKLLPCEIELNEVLILCNRIFLLFKLDRGLTGVCIEAPARGRKAEAQLQ